MEHLTYSPDAQSLRAEAHAAAQEPFEVLDWARYDEKYGRCPPVDPNIFWLGHNHVESSYYHSHEKLESTQNAFHELYGRDWYVNRFLQTGNIRNVNRYFHDSSVSDHELAEQTAAYLQAWLYFGLLEAIVSRPVSTSYFIRAAEDGQSYMYSRNLPVLLEAWMEHLGRLTDAIRQMKLREARECAGAAHGVLLLVLQMSSDNGKASAITHLQKRLWSIEPSIAALLEAVIRFIEVKLDTHMGLINEEIRGSPKTHLKRLVERGWCPFMVAISETALPRSLLRYIDVLALKPFSQGHDQCSVDRCERNYIRKETYTQKHWPESCRCEYMRPNLARMCNILRAGYIPLIEWNETSNNLEYGWVHPNDGASDYVAFSHVWADGLGSDTETGLPLCQIRKLSRLAASRLTHGSFFWIDGMCVPRQEPYRSKAIQLMYATYQNATGVIVLDSGLQETSTETPTIEIGWRVFASGWFGRMWTYQESMLPPWVEIEVINGFIDMNKLISDLHGVWTSSDANPFPAIFVRDLVGVLQKARPLYVERRERSMQKRICDLHYALSHRGTSRPGDQLWVMGALLDLEIKDLLDLDGEERWKAFYLSLRQIPWTIVFDRRTKMTLRGFEWAPVTWLSEGRDEWLHYDESLANISEDGLVISLKLLMLDEPQTVNFSILYVNTGSSSYKIVRSGDGGSHRIQTFTSVVVRHFENEPPDIQLQSHESTYVIVGLAVSDDPGGSKICFEFLYDASIELVLAQDESDSTNIRTVTGSWQQREVCFV